MTTIRFVLNGREVQVAGTDPHMTLLEYLRDAGLTGAKEGCGEGECGACAVVLTQPGSDGEPAEYRAVNSCLVPLPAVAGHEVITVEGLTPMHPVQAALAAAGGSQCGYCTPGFVMSLFAEYYRPGRTTPGEGAGFDAEALSGNLCRCTGYRPIREAAERMEPPAADDPWRQRLQSPAPTAVALDCAGPGGRFLRPTTLADLCAILAATPGARPLAGGTDLAVAASQCDGRWPTLVALEAVPELQQLTWTEGCVEIGAGVTLSALETRLRGRLPLLEQLLPLFASRLIRNRATLGGNLATASPIGDAAPVLLALDARVRLASVRGERCLPLDQFFTGYRRTALAADEVLVAVQVPLPLAAVSRFYKVAKRRRDNIATVAAAFALDRDAAGRVTRMRLAFGGVAATPLRARAAEAALVGRPWGAVSVGVAQRVLAEAVQPISDHRGSADYRRQLVLRLLDKFYLETQGVAMWD